MWGQVCTWSVILGQPQAQVAAVGQAQPHCSDSSAFGLQGSTSCFLVASFHLLGRYFQGQLCPPRLRCLVYLVHILGSFASDALCTWTALGLHLDCTCVALGLHFDLDCTCTALALHLDCTWIALGLHLDCTCVALGLHLDCTLTALGLHLD